MYHYRYQCLVLVLLAHASGGGGVPDGFQAQQATLTEEEQITVNSLLDNILVSVRRQIEGAGKDVLPLPDFIVTKAGVLVEGTGGTLRSLSSVRRVDNATLSYGGGNVTFGASFGLSTLRLSYDVKASLALIGKSGHVNASVEHNSIGLAAGLHANEDVCWVGVDSMYVRSLGGIKLHIKGFGFLNHVIERIANADNGPLDPQNIRKYLDQHLRESADKFRAPCVSLIPGLSTGTINETGVLLEGPPGPI